ncbi:DUF262 domain-containing protein [Ureaplasma diversum]|uniref:DUF262 domain-containing protein n=1 Tax=Ureaplasma diversum NCTC 246 TaxID=1188241 RepID=A0A084EXL3_9BACT|nr:DUF262 domain-containing protein [Ureaplasma diversum]KEZ22705.1 hypothetical protein UDIV_5120 [Ureaplasma diversum NCTC 246]
MNSKFQSPVRVGLLDFLKDSINAQLIVPIYQRNYTWLEDKEVKQYLRDLEDILISNCSNHFLGIIIYLDIPLDHSKREFSIIDGQQRITTTFLTLYAIKAILKQTNNQNSNINLEPYLYTNCFINKDNQAKLKPQVADDNVYQLIVEDKIDEIDDKKSQVYKNYCYILDYIKKLVNKHSIETIINALNKLHIVCIPLSQNYDNPQKIFESINSIGMHLELSDLIKNYLLMDLDSEKQDKFYTLYWEQILRLLDHKKDKLETFFRLFLHANDNKKYDQNIIYQQFVLWCTEFEKKRNREDSFKEIIKYIKHYAQIHVQKLSTLVNELQPFINDYRQIKNDCATYLLMSFFDLFTNNKINKKQLSELIRIVNNYLIRRAFCGLDIANLYQFFSSVHSKINQQKNNSYSNIVSLLKKLLFTDNKTKNAHSPTNLELSNYITNANMYRHKNILRLFFDKLEHNENPAPVNLDNLSIEHIAPKNHSTWWLNHFNTDKDTYNPQINRLGNLTLASRVDNNKMGNNDWKSKKKILEKTKHLKINAEILKQNSWTTDQIDQRTNQLIQAIITFFSYEKD